MLLSGSQFHGYADLQTQVYSARMHAQLVTCLVLQILYYVHLNNEVILVYSTCTCVVYCSDSRASDCTCITPAALLFRM